METLLIAILTFLGVIAIGGAVIAGREAQRKRLQKRLEHEGSSRDEGVPDSTTRAVRTLGHVGAAVSTGVFSQTLKKSLASAGYQGPSAPAVYIGAKVTLLLLGSVTLLAIVLPTPLEAFHKVTLVLLGAGGLFFVPNVLVYVRRRAREIEIRHHLPEAVDMLEICISAGIGLDMAWNMVAEEIRPVSGHLADEMTLTNLEIHLGVPRIDAMQHMAERTGADELGSLVGALVQSERFGTSVGVALRTFAEGMREDRSANAQESAEITAVKLLFPMVLCIFPALLIVIAGPAAIRFTHYFMNN